MFKSIQRLSPLHASIDSTVLMHCIAALAFDERDMRHQRVVVAGAGTGTTALEALRLGCKSVVALDEDQERLSCLRAAAEETGLHRYLDTQMGELRSIRDSQVESS